MGSYIHLVVHTEDQLQKDILSAHLFDAGFEGIEEKDDQLNAFVKSEAFDEKGVKDLLDSYELSYAVSLVSNQNWNALWESNFDPITVGDFCSIRAEFHKPNNLVPYEVLITPKMSFGTGHHATTYMMVQEMRVLDFKNMVVADFGTGTGVLAILAEKLGASKILAVDYDDYSIENATENISKNHCTNIDLRKTNVFSTSDRFDIILANINKNVIIDNLKNLSVSLGVGGKILLSGLLKEDEYDILLACQAYNLRRLHTVERDKWIAVLLDHIS